MILRSTLQEDLPTDDEHWCKGGFSRLCEETTLMCYCRQGLNLRWADCIVFVLLWIFIVKREIANLKVVINFLEITLDLKSALVAASVLAGRTPM